GVGVVADQSPAVRATARLPACLRAAGQPRLRLPRRGPHPPVAPPVVPVGGAHRGHPVLAEPLGLGPGDRYAMTRRLTLLASLGALGLIMLLWRVDLNAVKLSLLHVGWGMALVLCPEIVAPVR